MIRLLIANRGEIARRILKACREKNIYTGVIATVEDKNSLVCQEADEVIEVESFLNAKQIVAKAKEFGAQFLHPGYGFLSENSYFAQLCEQNNISFIGPTSEQIKLLGSKESSKKIAQSCKVPVLSSISSHELKKIPLSNWKKEFEKRNIFSPYLIKASGGGGGRGMRVVQEFENIPQQLKYASDEAKQAFNDDTVFVERYLRYPRHIEAQVFGDGKGGGVFFGERECSLQRRHQKVLEESPSVIISEEMREKIGNASLSIVQKTKYRGAGTVEFLFDQDHNFYFLEMNTRLQVEHPVTELTYGVDLVHAQIELAMGLWPFPQDKDLTLKTVPSGVALEARILAEDPRQNFIPTPGKIEKYHEPFGDGVRIDSGVTQGSEILPNFDSMIAKLIVHAPTREQAIQKLQKSLKEFEIFGITTNIPFLIALSKRDEFLIGDISTHFIEEHLKELNKPLVSKIILDKVQSFAFREKIFEIYQTQLNQKKIMDVFLKQKNSEFAFSLTEQNYSSFINENHNMELILDGEKIILENPGYYSQSFSNSDQDVSELKAPMAGKVYEIKAKEGDQVQKGDVLFIIESMKMQIEVRAGISGHLKNIMVVKDQILIGKNTLGVIEKIIN